MGLRLIMLPVASTLIIGSTADLPRLCASFTFFRAASLVLAWDLVMAWLHRITCKPKLILNKAIFESDIKLPLDPCPASFKEG